jgi:hypothetical protein
VEVGSRDGSDGCLVAPVGGRVSVGMRDRRAAHPWVTFRQIETAEEGFRGI